MKLDTIATPGHDAPVLLHDLRRAVRAYCDRAGLYEKDVAAQAGLTKSAMSKALAAGRPDNEAPAKHEPRLSTAERIAAAVGLRVGLLSGAADPLAAALSDAVAALRRAADAAELAVDRGALALIRPAIRDLERLLGAPTAPTCSDVPRSLPGHVSTLDLTARVERLLVAAGVVTVDDLTHCVPAVLLKIPAFGPACLREVEEALAAHGLRLAGGAQ